MRARHESLVSVMVNLAERKLCPELLEHASSGEAQLNLANLRRLNRWTGAHGRFLRELHKRFARKQDFRLLDVGAASGDMTHAARSAFSGIRTVSLDLSAEHLRHATDARVVADAFHLPFRDSSFEVVHCSLFLHHFDEAQVLQLLLEMHRSASKLVLIQDLHRHMLAYYFLPATRWIFGWDRLMLHDGPISVAAGWKRKELEHLLMQAGLTEYATIHWHLPSFRYFIAINKPN